MKRPRSKRPEPRTELLGLNLTDADLAELNELFCQPYADSNAKMHASKPYAKFSCVPMFRSRSRSLPSRQT